MEQTKGSTKRTGRLCRMLYASGMVNRWCDRPAKHEGPCAGMVLPRYRVGQTVRITDPYALAVRITRATADGTLRGAGYPLGSLLDRQEIETDATIYATTAYGRLCIGWADGERSLWIDGDLVVPTGGR